MHGLVLYQRLFTTAFSQVELFLDIKAFTQISSQ